MNLPELLEKYKAETATQLFKRYADAKQMKTALGLSDDDVLTICKEHNRVKALEENAVRERTNAAAAAARHAERDKETFVLVVGANGTRGQREVEALKSKRTPFIGIDANASEEEWVRATKKADRAIVCVPNSALADVQARLGVIPQTVVPQAEKAAE